MASLLLYSISANTIICAALGILCWSIFNRDVTAVFFNLRIVSKSPAGICPPIGSVLELHSCANLPCLVKLALNYLLGNIVDLIKQTLCEKN